MSKLVILENVANERGESAAKVARTLVSLGCDLYLHFGPSRKSRPGRSFFPEHPNGGMEHNIGPGDHPLTKDSQEVVIKRLGRGDTSTLGLFVLIFTKIDSSKTATFQIELTETDESICVVVDPGDVAKLPPPSQIEGTSEASTSTAPKRNFLKISPISIFIEEQISNGRYEWQEAWSELWGNIAENKNAKIEDMKLHRFGEKEAFIKRAMKHTSNKLDHAIEYEEDGIPTFKTVSRQSFGRMFRKALKKSRTLSDSPK